MFAAMSVSLISCGGSAGSGNSEVSAEKDTVVPSGVETRVVDNLMVSWVKDNDGNKCASAFADDSHKWNRYRADTLLHAKILTRDAFRKRYCRDSV